LERILGGIGSAGGGSRVGWIIAGGLTLGIALLLWLPVRVAIALGQNGFQAGLTVEVRWAGLRFEKAIDISHNLATALEHIWKRWREKGEPVKPELQETVGRAPRQKLLRAALPALRRLGRATQCRRLRLRVEVGGLDAMESALLAGTVWGGAGMVVGQVSRWVRVAPDGLSVAVVPNFERPTWRVNLDCILAVRLGKAIAAILWLLRQELGRKEVIAWVRDSLRRKGDQTDVRAPHSGPDEDGHGKP
jgi:hypothetical protein